MRSEFSRSSRYFPGWSDNEVEVIEGMRHLLQMEEIDGHIAAADAALAAMAE